MCRLTRSASGCRRRAFTLVEMAMVLVIIGLIIVTVFPALSAARMAQQRAVTQNNLQALLRATAAYAQANGCLPCPTPASTLDNGFGRVRGASGTVAACGACPADGVSGLVAEGVAPFLSLGLPASTARDGWGRWITMRIDPLLAGGTSAFTVLAPPTTPALCTCTLNGSACKSSSTGCSCAAPVGGACAAASNVSMQGLCTASLSTASGASPVQLYQITDTGVTPAAKSYAVIFVSHGSAGVGAFVAGPQLITGGINGCRLPSSGSTSCLPTAACSVSDPSTAAACNASGTNHFVEGVTGSTYDDLMIYADRNALVSLAGNPACQTVW